MEADFYLGVAVSVLCAALGPGGAALQVLDLRGRGSEGRGGAGARASARPQTPGPGQRHGAAQDHLMSVTKLNIVTDMHFTHQKYIDLHDLSDSLI